MSLELLSQMAGWVVGIMLFATLGSWVTTRVTHTAQLTKPVIYKKHLCYWIIWITILTILSVLTKM